jgi:hypothetical protein
MYNVKSAILRNCRCQWRKVARVVWLTHNELSFPDSGASYDIVEQELKTMVDGGVLEIAGDLSNWRYSEVRLAKT